MDKSAKDHQVEIRQEVTRRLDLLTETSGAVLKFDADGDGVLDHDEWEMVRSLVEAAVVHDLYGEESESDEGQQWSVEAVAADPNVDLPVLEVLDKRYEVLSELGHGSQGRTLLARRREDGHYVAVKELDFDTVDSWKALELFEREGEVLRKIDHPRIPAFVDSFHIDADGAPARFFLVQSFVSGTSLDVLLARGEHISELDVLEFARDVLETLDYLHTLVPPVIHRDIKPSNLILQPDGSYTLVDFGGAQVVPPDDTGGSTIIGTTGYMPPEQLMGRAGPQSDLYALGATMVHLVTHVPPQDLPTSHLKLLWRDRSNVSKPLADFIDRLIEPVVEDRFQSAAEALRHTDAMLGQATSPRAEPQKRMPIRASEGAPVERRRSSRRRRQVGDATVFDLSKHQMGWLIWTVALIAGLASLITTQSRLGMWLLLAGVGGLQFVSQRESPPHEELWVFPDRRFRIFHRTSGPTDGTMVEGDVERVLLEDGSIVLVTSDGARHHAGRGVSASVRERVVSDLRHMNLGIGFDAPQTSADRVELEFGAAREASPQPQPVAVAHREEGSRRPPSG